MIGFPVALQQRFDGPVLHTDLSSKKLILAFQALDVSGRDRSRLGERYFGIAAYRLAAPGAEEHKK